MGASSGDVNSRLTFRPSPSTAYATWSPFETQLGQHAGQLAPVQQQVVGPLQAGAQTGDLLNPFSGGQAQAHGQLGGTRGGYGGAQQEGHQQTAARRSPPRALLPAPPRGLLLGQYQQALGRTGGGSFVGRRRWSSRCAPGKRPDGPAAWWSEPARSIAPKEVGPCLPHTRSMPGYRRALAPE